MEEDWAMAREGRDRFLFRVGVSLDTFLRDSIFARNVSCEKKQGPSVSFLTAWRMISTLLWETTVLLFWLFCADEATIDEKATRRTRPCGLPIVAPAKG